jgi:hypothetical protein
MTSFEKNSALWSAPNTAVVANTFLTAIVQETIHATTAQHGGCELRLPDARTGQPQHSNQAGVSGASPAVYNDIVSAAHLFKASAQRSVPFWQSADVITTSAHKRFCRGFNPSSLSRQRGSTPVTPCAASHDRWIRLRSHL